MPETAATKRQEEALARLVTDFMLERCLLQFPGVAIEDLTTILKLEKAAAALVKKHKRSSPRRGIRRHLPERRLRQDLRGPARLPEDEQVGHVFR